MVQWSSTNFPRTVAGKRQLLFPPNDSILNISPLDEATEDAEARQ
jgi:hypothetical protein